MKKIKTFRIVGLLFFVILTAYLLGRLLVSEEHQVLKVIDGDTVVLNDNSQTIVRYIGIDTPELLTIDSPGEPYSAEAKKLNEQLLRGRKIKLEFDKEKYDHFGRLLAYLFADDVLVNEEIVRRGFADKLEIKPNLKYSERIRKALKEAQKSRVGIWSDISTFVVPEDNKYFLIKTAASEDYIGQSVVVRSKITDYRKSDRVLILKIENDLDIVIFKNNWDNFSFFGITPEKYYLGNPVEVIGRIKLYKGRPQIIVNHPITLKKLL